MGDWTGRRDVLIGAICLGGAALGGWASGFNVPRLLPAGGLAALVPRRIGAWQASGDDGIILAEDGGDLRGPYDDLIARTYRSALHPPVTLVVAFSGSQLDVRIHRPENCYPAAGYALDETAIERLGFSPALTIPATLVRARAPTRTEQVLYWTRIGNRFPTDNLAQRWAVVQDNLVGRVPDGVLVRLSTPGADRARAQATFHAFLRALYVEAPMAGARLLFGDRR